MFNAVILMCAIVDLNVSTTKCANIELGLHRTRSQCETVLNLGKNRLMKTYIEDKDSDFMLIKEGFCFKEDTPS